VTADADRLDALVAAVTEPSRRRVLDLLLARGDATATTLAGELPISRQAVVKHLVVLDRVGLVEVSRQGREVRYAVRPDQLELARRRMAEIATEWDTRLATIKRLAEVDDADTSRPASPV
jgi:DNA-binding transcriptional ArsR family regulator